MEEQNDKKIQTVIRCTPHVFVTEENKSTIFRNVACQTVIEISPTAEDTDIYLQMEYLPYSEIAENCIRELDLPRKAFLSWGAAVYAPVDKSSKTINETTVFVTPISSVTDFKWDESIEESDENKAAEDPSKKSKSRSPAGSNQSISQTSQTSFASFHGYTFGQKQKTQRVNGFAQTYIGVTPMVFVKEDDIAVVTTEEGVQSDITCSPNASNSKLIEMLNSEEDEGRDGDSMVNEPKAFTYSLAETMSFDVIIDEISNGNSRIDHTLSVIAEETNEGDSADVFQNDAEKQTEDKTANVYEHVKSDEEVSGSQDVPVLVGILKQSNEKKKNSGDEEIELKQDENKPKAESAQNVSMSAAVKVPQTETKAIVTEIAGCFCSSKEEVKKSETDLPPPHITSEETNGEPVSSEISEPFHSAMDEADFDTDNEISHLEDIEENTIENKTAGDASANIMEVDKKSFDVEGSPEPKSEPVAIGNVSGIHEDDLQNKSKNVEDVTEESKQDVMKDAEIFVQKSLMETKPAFEEICHCDATSKEKMRKTSKKLKILLRIRKKK